MIDFILENLFFVAIVIGGLFSFFSRMANGEQEQEKRGGRPQRTGQAQRTGENQGKMDWREIFFEEEVKSDTPRKLPNNPTFEDVQVTNDQDLLEVDLYRERVEAERNKKRAEKLLEEQRLKNSSKLEEQRRREKGLELHLDRLSNQEAMKAVVWSEVLGRPRARQPHNTFIRKR